MSDLLVYELMRHPHQIKPWELGGYFKQKLRAADAVKQTITF